MADTLINTLDTELTAEQLEAQKIYFEDGDQTVVDLSGIAEMTFEAIPKGIYRGKVVECNYGLAKDKGDGAKRYGRFELVIDVEGGQYNGRKHYFYASFSPKALSGTKTALLKLAPTIFDGPFKPAEIANSGNLLGLPVRYKIDHEEYQGQNRSKISYILDLEGPTATEGSGAASGGFFG